MFYEIVKINRLQKSILRRPGIEPESREWESSKNERLSDYFDYLMKCKNCSSYQAKYHQKFLRRRH